MVEWRHLQVKRFPLLLIQLVQREGNAGEEGRGRHLRDLLLPTYLRILPDVTASSGLLEVVEEICASDPEVARAGVIGRGV